MRSVIPVAVFVGGALAFAVGARLSAGAVLVSAGTFVLMAIPGIVWTNRISNGSMTPLSVLIYGTVLGLALGRVVLAAVLLWAGPDPTVSVAALAAVAAVSLLAGARSGFRLALSPEDREDLRGILAITGLLFIALALPYSQVGRLTDAGHAFVPYFDRDYFNHVALTGELARAMPPENPYCAGERLHYYWGFHVWPATVLTAATGTAADALNATILPTAGLFVAAVALWLRAYVPGKGARFAAIGIGLFAYSFIGPLYLAKLGLPAVATHLPGVSNREYSFLSHSWFRDALYEPHALSALTMLATALGLAGSRRAIVGPSSGIAIGLLFGVTLVTDGFIAVVGVAYYASAHLRSLFRHPRYWLPHVASAGVVVAIGAAAVALGIFPAKAHSIRVAVHPALRLAPAYLLIELGPLFLLGMAGIGILACRRRLRPYLPLVALLGAALALGFLLRVDREQNIALRKSLKVAQLPLMAFVGVTATAVIDLRKRLWAVAAVGVIAGGAVTLATDIARYLNPMDGRSPATTFVSADEMAFIERVRATTPPTAVLQCVDEDRLFGNRTDMVLPALAERRTFYGNDEMPAMFQVSPTEIAARKAVVRSLFASRSGDDMVAALAGREEVYLFTSDETRGPGAVCAELAAQGVMARVCRHGPYSLFVLSPGHPDQSGTEGTLGFQDRGTQRGR